MTPGIVQSKLDFTGNIPTNYLGTDQAAQGDLVQTTDEKDQINGYASLNVNGRLPTGSTPTSGTGTLHSIDFEFPEGEVTTLPSSITTTRAFTSYWAAQPGSSFLGNFSGGVATPTFEERVFPIDLIPGFDASRITSGTFEIDRLPAAKGVGADHSAGLLPDPSNNDVDSTAQPMIIWGETCSITPCRPWWITSLKSQRHLPHPDIFSGERLCEHHHLGRRSHAVL